VGDDTRLLRVKGKMGNLSGGGGVNATCEYAAEISTEVGNWKANDEKSLGESPEEDELTLYSKEESMSEV
jgi:hypothetical protein